MINKIKSISNMGVLYDVSPPSPDCNLNKYNLFYGFNGCGKTTLSRIFSSLALGKLNHLLPKEGDFKIELENGKVISKKENLDGIQGQIAVFNTDYVKENIRWEEGVAEAVFYIGKEQTEASNELEAAKSQTEFLRETLEFARKKKKDTDGSFSRFKSNRALEIDKKIPRLKFTAIHLAKGLEDYLFEEAHIQSDERLNQIVSKLGQSVPPNRIEQIKLDLKFQDFVEKARTWLKATAGTTLIQELHLHASMLRWVKEGQKYHVENNLDDCLFCGSPIPEDRLSQLDIAIDEKFNEIVEHTKKLKGRCRDLDLQIRAFLKDNRLRQISSLKQTPLTESLDLYQEKLTEALEIVELYETLIDEKLDSPNIALGLKDCCGSDEAGQIEHTAYKAVATINECIDEHNKECEDFDHAQTVAEERIKRHFFANCYEEYNQLQVEDNLAKTNQQLALNAVEENEALIANLTNKVHKSGDVAEKISGLIRAYLLHDDLKLDVNAEEGGFILRRNGKVIEGTLSEGEKTAIALCYFLASLGADGKKVEDWIVVIDDPISSLDTRAMNYAFSLLKATLTEAKQLVILTHNVNFMNECKKWLKKKNCKKEGNKRATLLYFDMKKLEGRRKSNIVPLPKLLCNFESEYHFLFSKVLHFAGQEGDLESEDQFLMPNAIRKVAEVFLTFKFPNTSDIAGKFAQLSKKSKEFGFDSVLIHALERLVQVESHGDNLDDIITFSSMTVEETSASARAILKIIYALDPEHYKRLEKQCRKVKFAA